MSWKCFYCMRGCHGRVEGACPDFRTNPKTRRWMAEDNARALSDLVLFCIEKGRPQAHLDDPEFREWRAARGLHKELVR